MVAAFSNKDLLFFRVLMEHQSFNREREYTPTIRQQQIFRNMLQMFKRHGNSPYKNSPYIGIMLDESMTLQQIKKLIMFCKIVYDNQLRIEFCANISIQDNKAETVLSIG